MIIAAVVLLGWYSDHVLLDLAIDSSHFENLWQLATYQALTWGGHWPKHAPGLRGEDLDGEDYMMSYQRESVTVVLQICVP